MLFRSPEEKALQYKKMAVTKKKNGMDFAKHFREQTEDARKSMYEKISKSNPKCIPVSCKHLETGEYNVFTSVGNACKWLKENGYTQSLGAKSCILKCLKTTHRAYNFEWNVIESQTTIESIAG